MGCSECKRHDSGLCPACGRPCGDTFVPEDDREENGKKFEGYVLELVESLDFFGNAKVSRNRRFQGKTQPGLYEIDIAVEINVEDLLAFLLIVECKDWRRPVDRPVVQKIIQTREAIAAQKAAIVSPLGFTKEAIEVAKAHGIALWVLGSSGSQVESLGQIWAMPKVAMPPKPLRPIYLVAEKVQHLVRGIRNYPRMRLMASLGERCSTQQLLDAQFARAEFNVHSGEPEWRKNEQNPRTARDEIFSDLRKCMWRAYPLYWLRI
jgi:hypothetical protein